MGGGPDKEHLLIIFWDAEPKDVIASIRKRFPYIEVSYYCLRDADKMLEDKSARSQKPSALDTQVFQQLLSRNIGDLNELLKKTTILVTLGSLPAKPEDAPNLKWIHFFSAGIDHHINHPIVKDTDIVLTTSSGIHGPPITEWCIMTTLAFSKHYSIMHELQKKHKWGGIGKEIRSRETQDWVGKRVGIAGYGSIGRQAARAFHALGAEILAYTASPRSTPSSRKDQGYIVPGTGDPDGTIPCEWYSGTKRSSFHHFLSQNLDVLLLTLPLTPATNHLIGSDEFEILSTHRSDALLSTPPPFSGETEPLKRDQKCLVLNISRGAVIDTCALVTALNTGQIRGACLDVTDPEPLPADHELWDAKNVIITPHVSGLGMEYMERAYDVMMVNLERRERGEKMVNVVDRRKGY